jgi:hypothetical protein
MRCLKKRCLASVEKPARSGVDEEELARAQRAALVAELSGETTGSAPGQMSELERASLLAAQEKIYAEYESEEDMLEYEGMSPLEIETAKRAKDKKRRIEMVFDEDLGRVVAKRRRKPGRSRGNWEKFTVKRMRSNGPDETSGKTQLAP